MAKKIIHTKATRKQRANQFLPFNALVGYYELILNQQNELKYDFEKDYEYIQPFYEEEKKAASNEWNRLLILLTFNRLI